MRNMYSSHKRLFVIGSLLLAALLNAQPPADWIIDPSDYEHIMTVTTQVQINGFPADSNLVLAAFVGNECRGVIDAINVLDNWLHFLMVRANGSGEQVSFQVWDGNLDTVLVADKLVIFSSDVAYGTVDTPFQITAQNMHTALIANADSIAVDEDIGIDIQVLDNDVFHTATPPQLLLHQIPEHGSAQVNGSDIINYSPDMNWHGLDSLAYEIINPWYNDTAWVYLMVAAVNDAPESFDQVSPFSGITVEITPTNLGDQLQFNWELTSDIDSDSLIYSIIFTGDLGIIQINPTIDTVAQIIYSDLLAAICDNGFTSISGTWQISVSDYDLSIISTNGPFDLTINAGTVGVDLIDNQPLTIELLGN